MARLKRLVTTALLATFMAAALAATGCAKKNADLSREPTTTDWSKTAAALEKGGMAQKQWMTKKGQ